MIEKLASIKGKTLSTLTQDKKFTILELTNDEIIFNIESTNKVHRLKIARLENIWRTLQLNEEISQQEIHDTGTVNSAYIAAILSNIKGVIVKLNPTRLALAKEQVTKKSKYRGAIEYALVYTELITAAKYRGTVTYQEIAKMMGIPLVGNYMSNLLGQILGEISDDEVEKGRPMLSAIAIGTNGLPGTGFYKLAREMGKLTDQQDEKFWEAEKKAVYETWKIQLKDKE